MMAEGYDLLYRLGTCVCQVKSGSLQGYENTGN